MSEDVSGKIKRRTRVPAEVREVFPELPLGKQRFCHLAVLLRGKDSSQWRWLAKEPIDREDCPDEQSFINLVQRLEFAAMMSGFGPFTDTMVWVQGDTLEQLEPGLLTLNAMTGSSSSSSSS